MPGKLSGLPMVSFCKMDREQVLKLAEGGSCNQPLPNPTEIRTPHYIVALTNSECCNKPQLLVKSRNGGFVSRNCLKCGKSARINGKQMPDLDCEGCAQFRRHRTVAVELMEGDFWYGCEACRRKWQVSEIIPRWEDLFDYNGLAAPGDPGFSS